ncbi:MAG: hypothetical protein KUG61_03400 [Parvibaculaceae bacterium]|nr:hypothetical protein [Parvibaculaceae bacterium]
MITDQIKHAFEDVLSLPFTTELSDTSAYRAALEGATSQLITDHGESLEPQYEELCVQLLAIRSEIQRQPGESAIEAVRKFCMQHHAEWQSTFGFEDSAAGMLSMSGYLARHYPLPEFYVSIATALGHAAFASPLSILPVYDAVARGWFADLSQPEKDIELLTTSRLSEAKDPENILSKPGRLPEGLMKRVWELVATPEVAGDALNITQMIASFGSDCDAPFQAESEQALLRHPGMATAVDQTLPATVKLEQLSDCPKGTLGHGFYHLITDNNFDVEVIDPTTLFGPLGEAPSPSEWMNRRALQLHDVWHITAEFGQNSEGEIGISGFQLAQLGQQYSANFLATITFMASAQFPAGIDHILTHAMDGWRRGRQTPPLALVAWETKWNTPLDQLRKDLSVAA